MKGTIQALAIVLVLGVTSHSHGAWGDYDTTFGFLGAIVDNTVTNHTPQGVAVQTDGKILVTGYRLVGGKKRLFLRRYLSNGQVDTSFRQQRVGYLLCVHHCRRRLFRKQDPRSGEWTNRRSPAWGTNCRSSGDSYHRVPRTLLSETVE
jgi:hypothetical protein